MAELVPPPWNMRMRGKCRLEASSPFSIGGLILPRDFRYGLLGVSGVESRPRITFSSMMTWRRRHSRYILHDQPFGSRTDSVGRSYVTREYSLLRDYQRLLLASSTIEVHCNVNLMTITCDRDGVQLGWRLFEPELEPRRII